MHLQTKSIKLANFKDRYNSFGLEVSSAKFASKWEIFLVFIVISTGLIITSFAALKAKGSFCLRIF